MYILTQKASGSISKISLIESNALKNIISALLMFSFPNTTLSKFREILLKHNRKRLRYDR